MANISDKKLIIFRALHVFNWIFVVITFSLVLSGLGIVYKFYESYYDLLLVFGGYLFLGILGLYQMIIMVVYGFYLKKIAKNSRYLYVFYWLFVIFTFALLAIANHYQFWERLMFVFFLIFTLSAVVLCLYFSRKMTLINELQS